MAGGGDHPGANKRKREAAGRPKRAKRKKPYEDPAAGGGGGAKGKPQPVTAKDKRVAAKEMSESRKPDYNLEKELTVLWVKMRGRDVSKEDIIKLVTEALRKMDGKYLGISGSHVNASVLRTCVKWCSQSDSGMVRRHIIRILKKLIMKLAVSDYGCLVVLEELTEELKELIFDKINSPHRPSSREEEAEAGNKERVWVLILAADHKCCEKLWAEFAASTDW